MRQHGWVGSPDYETLVAVLVEAREAANLTQRDLANRLGTAQSRVARIESRQRNVSLLEFIEIARALGAAPETLFAKILVRIAQATDVDSVSR